MANELIASAIAYIEPTGCDSTVGYKLTTEKSYSYDAKKDYPSFSGAIDLSDCTRKITWQFENNAASLAKINHAITILTNFKKEFVKAQKRFPKGEECAI